MWTYVGVSFIVCGMWIPHADVFQDDRKCMGLNNDLVQFDFICESQSLYFCGFDITDKNNMHAKFADIFLHTFSFISSLANLKKIMRSSIFLVTFSNRYWSIGDPLSPSLPYNWYETDWGYVCFVEMYRAVVNWELRLKLNLNVENDATVATLHLRNKLRYNDVIWSYNYGKFTKCGKTFVTLATIVDFGDFVKFLSLLYI